MPKNRLSKTDWLDHGLRTLARAGPVALKAEPLAASLQVSRGSFYWHFKNINAFHQAVFAQWRRRATDNVIARIEDKAKPQAKLNLLMQTAEASDNRLEQAIRSWATENPKIANALLEVDIARLDYLGEILLSLGVSAGRVHSRSVFIYRAWLGQIMMANDTCRISKTDLEAIADLFKS